MSVTIYIGTGAKNSGAWSLAVMVAFELQKRNLWNGSDPIVINEPSVAHLRMEGMGDGGLIEGRDYEFVNSPNGRREYWITPAHYVQNQYDKRQRNGELIVWYRSVGSVLNIWTAVQKITQDDTKAYYVWLNTQPKPIRLDDDAVLQVVMDVFLLAYPEPDGTSEYMIENQLGVPHGEDWLDYALYGGDDELKWIVNAKPGEVERTLYKAYAEHLLDTYQDDDEDDDPAALRQRIAELEQQLDQWQGETCRTATSALKSASVEMEYNPSRNYVVAAIDALAKKIADQERELETRAALLQHITTGWIDSINRLTETIRDHTAEIEKWKWLAECWKQIAKASSTKAEEYQRALRVLLFATSINERIAIDHAIRDGRRLLEKRVWIVEDEKKS